MSFRILSDSGKPITSLEEWRERAPPAGGAAQWKDGRSAKELARRWVAGKVPSEVFALLDSNPATRGFVAELAVAECETPLDSFRGGTRNHDLVVIGRTGDCRTLLAVEGKADESFDVAVAERLAAARQKPGSRVEDRVRLLAEGILGTSVPAAIGSLRYQLLQATGATLIEARHRQAQQAVFLVHEFRSQGLNSLKLERNHADFLDFARRLLPDLQLPWKGGTLAGPIRVRGGTTIPWGIPLFLGSAVHHL